MAAYLAVWLEELYSVEAELLAVRQAEEWNFQIVLMLMSLAIVICWYSVAAELLQARLQAVD